MSNFWSFFCPLCKASRRISFRPKPGGAKHVAQIAICALVFMAATWNWFTWKGIVAFVPFWLVFESIYRARVRVLLTCPQCGFDPYLYLNDAKRARSEVESHWRKKFAEKGITYPGDPQPPAEKPKVASLVEVPDSNEESTQ